MALTILCPKCQQIKTGTKHHVFPKRHFKRQKKPPIVYLCRDCHNGLEKLIPFYKMDKEFYINIILIFLFRDEEDSNHAISPVIKSKKNGRMQQRFLHV